MMTDVQKQRIAWLQSLVTRMKNRKGKKAEIDRAWADHNVYVAEQEAAAA